jgi:hypothetical protein
MKTGILGAGSGLAWLIFRSPAGPEHPVPYTAREVPGSSREPLLKPLSCRFRSASSGYAVNLARLGRAALGDSVPSTVGVNSGYPRLVIRLLKLGTATVYEVQGQRGSIASGIRPLRPAMKLVGTALTGTRPRWVKTASG